MDATDGSQIISIIALTIFFGGFVLAILVVFNKKTDKDEERKDEKSEEKEKKSGNNSNSEGVNKKNTAKEKSKAKVKDAIFTHPMLLTTLKGHTGSIKKIEFSKCGKYLGSCSEG